LLLSAKETNNDFELVEVWTDETSTKCTMDPEGTCVLTYSTIMPTVSPACA